MSVCINRESERNTEPGFLRVRKNYIPPRLFRITGLSLCVCMCRIDAVDFQYSLARNMILFRFLSGEYFSKGADRKLRGYL